MHKIEQQLIQVRQRIEVAQTRYKRPAGSTTLLAVSKTKSGADVRAAYAAGQRCFGENYLQEALDKQAELTDLAIEWHFIGPIQSNKTRFISENFDWVHTVDRTKIAQRLNDQRPDSRAPLNCCIQVNIDQSSSKSGVAPDELVALLEFCQQLPHLCVRGLMCIPDASETFDNQCLPFAKLAAIMNSLRTRFPHLDTLSMGMSQDLEAAIACGSTLVRIGTDIFGKRT